VFSAAALGLSEEIAEKFATGLAAGMSRQVLERMSGSVDASSSEVPQ
jgi:Mn-dependent DtxR family transcriptional regulator